MSEVLIKLGGVFHIAMAVFHLLFWKIFAWPENLQSLTRNNKAIMQVMNICLIAIFFLFAFVSFVYTDELVTTQLGNALILLVALFWLFRFILQFIFFNNRYWQSWLFALVVMLICFLYFIPFVLITLA